MWWAPHQRLPEHPHGLVLLAAFLVCRTQGVSYCWQLPLAQQPNPQFSRVARDCRGSSAKLWLKKQKQDQASLFLGLLCERRKQPSRAILRWQSVKDKGITGPMAISDTLGQHDIHMGQKDTGDLLWMMAKTQTSNIRCTKDTMLHKAATSLHLGWEQKHIPINFFPKEQKFKNSQKYHYISLLLKYKHLWVGEMAK